MLRTGMEPPTSPILDTSWAGGSPAGRAFRRAGKSGAAMLASAQKVNKLTVIVDYNKWQATGRSKEVLAIEPLKEKWESFGWDTQEIDGHDFSQIKKSLDKAKTQNCPSAIIAHTIKGKGVSFMEDNNNWHYRIPNEDELKMALDELSY